MTTYNTLKNYVLSCIDLSEYDRNEFPTLKSIIQAEMSEFINGKTLKNVSVNTVQNWLQGLPTACSVDFTDYDIEQRIESLALNCLYAELKPVENLIDWYWHECAKIIYTHAIIEGN